MIENERYEVRKFLPDRFEKMESRLRHELESGGERERHSLAWEFLASQAADRIRGVLDLDLFEVLAGAWTKVRKLQEYARDPKRSSNEHFDVTLGNHEFTKDLHPVLKYTIDGVVQDELVFTLSLTARVESVELEIHRGRILSIGSGKCLVCAQLKYGEEPLHDELTSQEVPLPGRYPLRDPGLEIARAD